MKKIFGLIMLVMVVAVGVVLFEYTADRLPEALSPAHVAAPVGEPPPAGPQVRHPLVTDSAASALPPIDGSDVLVRQALADLWGERVLEQLFNLNGFVRRVVATIDNLPRRDASFRLAPVKPAPGRFLTTGRGESLAISPLNAARYMEFVRFASAIDSGKLVFVYVRHYPLFQQAYVDLGYPNGYFNDRLVEVIDHLLAAPELPASAPLVQPKVFYKFEDADLESLSAGQKIMLRIGNDNAAAIKAKLREIRSELAGREPRQ
jgi:hypothetical protein